jgi:hypothetical protein
VPERGDQARRRGKGAPGPERPRWPFLVAGGLVYAGALLGVWIVLAGEPNVSEDKAPDRRIQPPSPAVWLRRCPPARCCC